MAYGRLRNKQTVRNDLVFHAGANTLENFFLAIGQRCILVRVFDLLNPSLSLTSLSMVCCMTSRLNQRSPFVTCFDRLKQNFGRLFLCHHSIRSRHQILPMNFWIIRIRQHDGRNVLIESSAKNASESPFSRASPLISTTCGFEPLIAAIASDNWRDFAGHTKFSSAARSIRRPFRKINESPTIITRISFVLVFLHFCSHFYLVRLRKRDSHKKPIHRKIVSRKP